MNNCCDTKLESSCSGESAHTAHQAPAAADRISSYRITQMDCPTEQRLITDKLSSIPGISQLHFNLLERTLHIHHQQDALEPALQAIRSLGFAPLPLDAAEDNLPSSKPNKLLWLAGVLALAAETVHFLQWGPDWLVALLALAAIACCGLRTYAKGWISVKQLNLNINALMSIAVSGAMLIGQWPEAAMVYST